MATIHDTDDEMAKYVASRTDEQNHLDELDRQVESLRFSANYYEKLWKGLKKVEMHPASKIKGDIQTPALSIALGAMIDGNLDMTGGKSKKVVDLVQEKK